MEGILTHKMHLYTYFHGLIAILAKMATNQLAILAPSWILMILNSLKELDRELPKPPKLHILNFFSIFSRKYKKKLQLLVPFAYLNLLFTVLSVPLPNFMALGVTFPRISNPKNGFLSKNVYF